MTVRPCCTGRSRLHPTPQNEQIVVVTISVSGSHRRHVVKKIGWVSRTLEPHNTTRSAARPQGSYSCRHRHRRPSSGRGRWERVKYGCNCDVVAAHRYPGELLRGVVHLIGAFEQLNMPKLVPRWWANPAAARSSASSQLAGRSFPASPTNGSVRRVPELAHQRTSPRCARLQ